MPHGPLGPRGPLPPFAQLARIPTAAGPFALQASLPKATGAERTRQLLFKIQASGSIIKGITKDDLVESKCLIPNENIVLGFHKIVKPIFNKLRKAKTENLNLIDLRDWLLPLLMNGQVKIK